jgi:hypothetical protein
MKAGLEVAQLVPAELVYGEGLVIAGLLIAFVFVFVGYTAGEWFVGAGVVSALIAALFIYIGWHELADYPATYRDGDRPETSTSGTSLYSSWELGRGATVDTQFTVDAPDAQTLSGALHQHGCSSNVDWRVYADGTLLASGTLANRDDYELKKVAVPTGKGPVVVRLSAARTDSNDCTTELSWENPGFEGPGNGKFRFVFPVPDPD